MRGKTAKKGKGLTTKFPPRKRNDMKKASQKVGRVKRK
jgi:hypothetical protein